MKKYMLILLVFVLGFGAVYITHSSAEQVTPRAYVVWTNPKAQNPNELISSINQGEDAMETWFLQGAVSATGLCTDGANINSSHSVSFGPQSFTFTNIQKSITCSVTGTASNGTTFTSGPQTVNVIPAGTSPAPTPTPNPTPNPNPNPTTPVATVHTDSGAAGKIIFVKKLIQGNIKTDNRPTNIMNLIAVKDKFIADAECNSGGVGSLSRDNLWVAAENGSSVTGRNGCQDSALGAWQDNFDADVASGILPDWAGTGDSFIHEVMGAGENSGYFNGNNYNRAVLYRTNGTVASPSSVGPNNDLDQQTSIHLVALKNKIIGGLGQVFSLSLSDWTKVWTKVGDIPDTYSSFVGFGDFAINSGNGQVFEVSSGSKTLVETLPVFQVVGYDNSTWPAKLALLSWSVDDAWYTTHTYVGTIRVYSLSGSTMVLNKTLTIRNASQFTFGFSVWGNYVAIPSYSDGHSVVELWDGSTATRLDAINVRFDVMDLNNSQGTTSSYAQLRYPAISKSGYLAVSTPIDDNAIYLYKLNVTPLAGGACTQGVFQIGARGDGVRALQMQLNTYGANLTVDGVYGPMTQAAVNKYCVPPVQIPFPPADDPAIITQSTSTPFAQTRTYTWTTTALNNGDIVWGVNWGDTSGSTSSGTCSTVPPVGTGKNWTYTTSHTWTNPGNYTVTVYASDCRNPTKAYSFTVNI